MKKGAHLSFAMGVILHRYATASQHLAFNFKGVS